MADNSAKTQFTVVGPLPFLPGVFGEQEAVEMLDEMCKEGCPSCGRRLERLGPLVVTCARCGVHLELHPGGKLAHKSLDV